MRRSIYLVQQRYITITTHILYVYISTINNPSNPSNPSNPNNPDVTIGLLPMLSPLLTPGAISSSRSARLSRRTKLINSDNIAGIGESKKSGLSLKNQIQKNLKKGGAAASFLVGLTALETMELPTSSDSGEHGDVSVWGRRKQQRAKHLVRIEKKILFEICFV